MVSYTEWTRAVHTRFKDMGGDYDGNPSMSSQDVVTGITEGAARWWNAEKARIKGLTFQQAVDYADKVINDLVDRGVLMT